MKGKVVVMDTLRFRGNKPERQNETDAGADLVTAESFTLSPGEHKIIETGTAIDLPPGFVGLIASRSGLGTMGVRVRNSVGVIDTSYKSDMKVCLENVSKVTHKFEVGDRIAQLLVVPIVTPKFTKGKGAWPKEERGGFGSSGK